MEPSRATARTEMLLPQARRSNTEVRIEIFAPERRLSPDPSHCESSTEIDLLICALENTETQLPILALPRRDAVEPRDRKSNADNLLPILDTVRKLQVLPNALKFKVEILAPKRPILCADMEEPDFIRQRSDNSEPSEPKLVREMALGRGVDRTEREEPRIHV